MTDAEMTDSEQDGYVKNVAKWARGPGLSNRTHGATVTGAAARRLFGGRPLTKRRKG